MVEPASLPTSIPIEISSDLSDDFFEKRTSPFVDGSKEELLCASLDAGSYALADKKLTLSNGLPQKMAISCTWNPQDIMVSIGLKAVETDTVYAVSMSGGAMIGTLDLSNIPNGEYQVIMFSNNNPELVSAMLYQII